MPMPVAHGLVGAMVVTAVAPHCVRQQRWGLLVAGALLAISPDLDFFFEWVLGWNGVHRTVTHALPFAFALGLVLVWRMTELRVAVALSLGLMSHALLDFAGSKLTSGVMLWWPFSTTYYKLGLVSFWEIETGVGTLEALRMHIGQLLLYSGIEAMIFGPLFLLVYSAARGATRRAAPFERTGAAG